MPSLSPIMAAPFWETWGSDSEIVSRAPEIVRTRVVSLLVEEELLNDSRLSTKIERFAMDVQNAVEGQVVIVPVGADATAFEMWLGNSQLYFSGYDNDHKSQLVGTILIGDVPIPVVDRGGRMHPTPWPLTDFEMPVYQWDAERERFVWESGGDEKAEIWHGIIRSDATSEEGRSLDLRGFFDRNHKVHEGSETFAKKVFIADLPQQKIGITDDQKQTYENWIDHLDDFTYLRYNKNLATKLFEGLNPANDMPMELLPPEVQDVNTETDFSALPDVLSKFIIDKMAQQYITSAREKLVTMLKPAMYTGRWESDDFDSTITLIAKKDEWAANLLRDANDEVEDIFRDKLANADIAAKAWLQTDFHFQPYYDHWVDPAPGESYSTEHHYIPIGEGESRERFHNGMRVSEFNRWKWDEDEEEMQKLSALEPDFEDFVENCSLVRGTAPDEDHPAAQMVEFNRVYNLALAGDGEKIDSPRYFDKDSCVYWAEASDHEKERDSYEGCCPLNLEFSDEGFDMTAPACVVNDGWDMDCTPVGEWECGIEITDSMCHLLGRGDDCDWDLTDIDGSADDFPSFLLGGNVYQGLDRYDDYVGATMPVFDRNGAKAVTKGVIGAQGCDEFIGVEEGWSKYATVEMSTLMIHDEPRLETLQAQARNQAVTSMPADDPRGASFYDHAEVFHRINFPSSFDFIHTGEEETSVDARREVVKAELDAELERRVNAVTTTSGNEGKMDLDLFRNTYWANEVRQNELLDALVWLGTDLEQKHIEMLQGALSETNDGIGVLKDSEFAGYEVIEVIAENADDGLQLAFERGLPEPSNVFSNAERESGEFELEMLKAIENGKSVSEGTVEELPEGWEEGEFSSNDKSGCSGINLLTWPAKCLMPWVAALPGAMGGVIPIKPGENSLPAEAELILEGNVQILQEVGELVVTPSEIVIAANDVMPITVSVNLKNKKGGVMETPVDVMISADSNDAENFLSVSPAVKRQAIAGKTQFSLIPKTSKVGGKFNFTLTAGEVTAEIPVTVTRAELSMSAGVTDMVAGETPEVEVSVNVINLDGEIINDADDSWLEFTSELGDFSASGRVQVDNGGAKLLFYPATTAGVGMITVRDESGLLPKDNIEIEIVPAAPSYVDLDSPEILILDAEASEVIAIVKDKYGNVIEKEAAIEWTMPRNSRIDGRVAEVKAETEGDVVISAEISGVDASKDSRTLSVVTSPQLGAEKSLDEIQAGENEIIEVYLTTDKEVPGEIELTVLNDKGVGVTPDTVTLVDGVAVLSIEPGTRAGVGLVSVQASGFIGTSFSFEVVPGVPSKIDLAMEESVIKLAEDEPEAVIIVRVLDAFGNTVPTYDGEISLLQNPGEKWDTSDIDALSEAGVFDEASSVKLYLEQNLVEKEMETDDVVEFDPTGVKISRYKREVKIKTQDTGGYVYLVATAVGLVSDTLEFEVTDTIEQADFERGLSPKSLLTLLLGNDGGKFNEPNFGNRFLFDGETQAVATLITDTKADKLLYSFDASGEMIGVTSAEFMAGNEFKVLINDQVKATIKGVSGEITVQENSRSKDGWNFVPADDVTYEFINGELLRDDSEFLKMYAGGGMRFVPGVEIIPTESWKQWMLEKDGKSVGTLYLVMDEADVMTDGSRGLLLESISSRVELRSYLTGRTIRDEKGIAAFDLEEKESDSKMLRSSAVSAEDAIDTRGVGWNTEWKPGTMFAAGNNAGESVQYSASDATVLLGDPTVSVATPNDKSELGISNDVGTVLWASALGAVDQILVGDLNGDGRSEILPRVGNILHVLYQARHQMDNFRDTGILLRMADGAQKVAIHNDSLGNLLHIIQLNDAGKLAFHRNENGTLVREYIDLGVGKKVVNFDVADLNGDMYSDLIILDSDNSLWFAYGHEKEWYAAQLVNSFAARFNDVSENYDAVAEQSGQDTEIDPFPQLESFYLSFDDVENSSWTDSLRVIGDTEYVSVSDNNSINALYKVSAEGTAMGDSGDGALLVPGARVNHSFKLSGNSGELKNVKLVIPGGVGFKSLEKSFTCEGCVELPKVKVGKTATIVGLGSVMARANVTLKWETEAEMVPPIRYMFRDMVGNDGIDDVAIAWQPGDGGAQTIQYLSNGGGTAPANSAEATNDVARSPILRTHRRVQEALFPELMPSDFDAEATAGDVMECMGEQRTEAGLPTMFTSQSVSEVQSFALAPQKKTSWIDYIPSIAILAPGPQSLYIPPFAIPLVLPWSMGNPVINIAIIPMIPFIMILPFVPALTTPGVSVFRLYVMPTTSLKLGLAICGGPPISMVPMGVPFPPQCFVIIPQFGSSSGGSVSSGDDSATPDDGGDMEQSSCFELDPASQATVQQEMMMQLYAQSGSGRSTVDFNLGAPFTIKSATKATNRQIKAADILGMWVQAQWRELTNFKFPRFSLKLPKFPKAAGKVEDDDALTKLKKSPFIDVKTKKITIQYPEISTERLEKLGTEIKAWKIESKESLEKTTSQWKKASCENIEGGTWDSGKKKCEVDPNAVSAFDLISEISSLQVRATKLRLKSTPLAVRKQNLITTINFVTKNNKADLTKAEKFNGEDVTAYEAKIEEEQKALLDIADETIEEDNDESISKGLDVSAELEEILEELDEKLVEKDKLKMSEAKALVGDKLTDAKSTIEKYQLAISLDIKSVTDRGPELKLLKIQGRLDVINVYMNSMLASNEIPAEEKEAAKVDVEEKEAAREKVSEDKKAVREEKKAERKKEREAKKEERKTDRQSKKGEARDKLKGAMKKIFEDITVEPLEKKWREFETAVDKNVLALKSYPREVEKLKEIPKKLNDLLDQIVGMADVVNEYWAEWIEKNEKSVKRWEQFGADAKKAIKAWGDIPLVLKKFGEATAGSNGGSMTRGTLLSWLKNLMLSAIKFPIIPMPQIPDVEIDLSSVKIGMTVEVPQIEFTAVKVSPGDLPLMPTLNLDKQFSGAFAEILKAAWNQTEQGGVNVVLKGQLDSILLRISAGTITLDELDVILQALPEAPELAAEIGVDMVGPLFTPLTAVVGTATALIPVVPVLPEAPKLPDASLELPPLLLPTLPSLIEPPKFPDFLKIPNLIMAIPKALFALLSMLSRGLMPVPEWYVATAVVNATNRTLLIPLDFIGKLPMAPKMVLPPIKYKLNWEFAPALPSLTLALETIAMTFNSVTTMISNSAKGLPIGAVDVSEMGLEDQVLVASETVNLLPEFGEIEKSLDVPEYRFARRSLASVEPNLLPREMKNWQASAETTYMQTSDFPASSAGELDTSYLDADVESSSSMSDVPSFTGAPVVEPRILWFDAEKEKVESVIDFPLTGQRYTYNFADLDRDGNDEIVYSIGSQVFMKRLIEPNFTEEEEDMMFETPETLIEWSFDKFASALSPADEYSSTMKPEGVKFEFMPTVTNETSYFEWVISDRPDRVFETLRESTDRASNTWRRIGFLVRPPAAKYEIRPAGAQISSVSGNPLMYGTPLAKVKKVSESYCDDPDAVLPFFAEETIFVGVGDRSRLKIRTLAREGQRADEREIELRQGEETVVDFAEVCLTRGEVEYIAIGDTMNIEPKKGDYFFSGMRLELGSNDEVELDIYDETKVVVSGREKYELYQFDSREEAINSIKELADGNWYGQFTAFQGEESSWTRSNDLIHDPQPADDRTPPRVKLRRGTKRKVSVGQKIEIDATKTIEKKGISRVWWESKGNALIDSKTTDYSPMELLKVLLPIETQPTTFDVVLHVIDLSGNEAIQNIEISIIAPDLTLSEVSARDASIRGKIEGEMEGIEVWFMRERDGRQEILSRTAKSDKKGNFLSNKLSKQGGVLLREESSGVSKVEILANGRPVILQDDLLPKVYTATDLAPVQIELSAPNGESSATISFVGPVTELEIPYGIGRGEISEGVQLVDVKEDDIEWREGNQGNVELWNTLSRKVLGVIGAQGDFRRYSDTISLALTQVGDEMDPVAFDVIESGNKVAEIVFPKPDKITVK